MPSRLVILEILADLEARLRERRITGSLKIVGGAALARLYPDDEDVRPTEDVDALFHPEGPVLEVAAQIAVDRGLRQGWLNSAAAPFMPSGLHPRTADGFDVYPAEPEELIAMKMARGAPQDIADLRILARHTGISSSEELVDIAYRVYGEESVLLQDGRASYLLLARDVLG